MMMMERRKWARHLSSRAVYSHWQQPHTHCFWDLCM